MADRSFANQWRWLSWVLMALVASAALVVGASGESGPATDGERVSQLAGTIRCPQCRGQSVAESNVAIAREIRGDIRNRIAAGETDDQIRQVYIDRFGRSIVLNPDSGGFTGLVWVVPVVAAAVGAAAVGFALVRWRAEAADDDADMVTDDDRELVRVARSRRTGANG